MEGIVSFVTAHWVDITVIIVAVERLFAAVAKLTTTTVDDKIAAKIEEILPNFIGKK